MKINWLRELKGLKSFIEDSLEPKENWLTLKDIIIAIVTLLFMDGVLIWCANQENDMLITLLYQYFAVCIFGLTVIIVLKFYFRKKLLQSSERTEKRIKRIYGVVIVVALVIGIPMFLMLKVLSRVLSYRAGTFENLTNAGFLICLNLVLILVFFYPNCVVVDIAMIYILQCFSTIIWNTYAVSLMLFLTLYLIELNLANFFVLRVMHYYGKTLLKKEVLEKYGKHEAYKTDIDEEIYQEQKRSFEKRRSDALEYDVAYHKKTLWKFQLMCLIGLFAIGIFAPEEVTSQQGDFINVLTWFTVLMLYWDKRKAWK